ncbi:putative receptor-like protein kinase At2g23200 [Bidens hawaiensis]|uniref:putative receptor-like protein kinase At2g23200 n=1 Tax=Bidens hawaiensis TaxID=980011 RepID=UPI00404A9056
MSKVISQQSSGVITKVKGTFGYLDPEYCNTGKLTKESDVYSFGVVLFELLSGRCALDTLFVEDGINLAGWAKRCIKERRLDQVVSANITTQISPKCLKVFVRIAERCLKSSRKERPTMTDVSTLQLSMALQEQYAISAQGAGSTCFTHRMQRLLFGSRLNSADPPNSGSKKIYTAHTVLATKPSSKLNQTVKQLPYMFTSHTGF